MFSSMFSVFRLLRWFSDLLVSSFVFIGIIVESVLVFIDIVFIGFNVSVW